MLALAYYLGANVKRFSRRFENGFDISLDELETLWRARLERFEDVLNETK